MIYLTKWGECVMADELFTVAQAAEYLKVCDKTVRRMIASKELVASKVGSRSWRIRKDDIDAYLNATSTGQEGADTSSESHARPRNMSRELILCRNK